MHTDGFGGIYRDLHDLYNLYALKTESVIKVYFLAEFVTQKLMSYFGVEFLVARALLVRSMEIRSFNEIFLYEKTKKHMINRAFFYEKFF